MRHSCRVSLRRKRLNRANSGHVVIGDALALPPALYRRVVFVAQRAGQWADAAAFAYECYVIHTPFIRTDVRRVNVENVMLECEKPYVADDSTIGAKLRAMRGRSGRSLANVAKAAGYKTASGVQRYFEDDYDAEVLPLDIARKIADGFSGTPISREEVFALAGFDVEPDAIPVQFEGPSQLRLPRDIPVYGTALGGPRTINGAAIEQTSLDEQSVIEYLVRPPILQNRRDVYGFYIQGSSMVPRFEEGEMGFAEGKRPPRVGDDVLVYMCAPGDTLDGDTIDAVLIKRLVRRTADYVELEQFNPALTFRVPSEKVKRIHRVIRFSELLS